MDINKTSENWYLVDDADAIDSPALLIYKERARENIIRARNIAGDVNMLRPHVKTNKIAEVCRMMMEEGINKFKCATIAEAEMLGSINAGDVLVAYPVVGPKVERFVRLIKKYPETDFSCLVDNGDAATNLSAHALKHDVTIDVFMDINTGMNRTGLHPDEAITLFTDIAALKGINIKGLHVYDGHIHDKDLSVRRQRSDEGFANVDNLWKQLIDHFNFRPVIVAGGSPTFPIHAGRKNVECSPGTFVFWDFGYKTNIPDQPFDFAALVLTRIVSIIDHNTVCTDLGYKSVASEGPQPRVHFLNAPDAEAVGHSEEHLVLRVKNAGDFNVGDVLYGVPVHICPTVALYEKASIVVDRKVAGEWKVIARDRKINI